MTCSVPKAIIDELAAHAVSTFPEECCGFVVERNGQLAVERITNIQNQQHALHPEQFPRTAAIAYTMGPDDSLTLQIIGSATPFENFTAFGVIDISDVDLTLPTANSAVVHFEKSLKSDKPPVTTGGLLGI